MPELGSYGSVRGAAGNSRPYRDSQPRYIRSGTSISMVSALRSPKRMNRREASEHTPTGLFLKATDCLIGQHPGELTFKPALTMKCSRQMEQ